MFALITGKPIIFRDRLILDVNRVGYDIQVNNATLQHCAGKDEVSLHIYTYVREDRIELYGFVQPQEKELFELLIDVSGVGPKTALSITEKGSAALVEAVQQANVAFFTKVPRVGKKSAQKIIIELKTKLGGLKDLDLKPLSSKEWEISEALQSLGFSESESEMVLKQLDVEELALEEAVQKAIQLMGKGRYE